MKQILIVLLLVLSLSIVIPASGQSTVWRYAYLQRTGTDPFLLALVDPLQPSNPPQFLPVNLPNNPTIPAYNIPITSSIPSPDGQWILFDAVNTKNTLSIFLFNTTTRALNEIAQMTLLGKDPLMFGPAQDAVWSPNSQYIALNARNPAPGDDFSTDIFIYRLSDKTLTRLTLDNLRDYRVAWSPDSARIVTTIDDCVLISANPLSINCNYRIEVFNITSSTPIISVDTTDIVNLSGGIDSVCLLEWSPDGRYVSFFAGCREGGSPYAASEIWLLDTNTASVQQITNYTGEFMAHPTGLILAVYDTAWYDAQTLLVGVAVSRDYKVVNNRMATLAYRITDHVVTPLSTSAADSFTVNPITQEIAYRAIPNYDAQFFPQTPSVQVSIFNGSALSTVVNTAGGCELAWQPTGEILASAQYGGTLCRGNVGAISFVNRTNNTVLDHITPAGSGVGNTQIIPIGWVLTNPNPISGDAP